MTLSARTMASMVDPLPRGAELQALWQEYAHGTSAEGRFVKACDKLDMALMAARYHSDEGVDTTEFIESALARLNDPELRSLAFPTD